MEETVDLRPYLSALGRYFWLIGGAVILAILIALAFYFSSDDYQAVALVTVPEPTQQLQFDPRIETTTRPNQLLNVYPELAKSNDLLARLLPQAEALSDGRIATATQLRTALQVNSSSEGRMVRLAVTDKDPEVAAGLANAWAREFIATVEAVYGRGGVEFFRGQLDQASQELQTANDALVAFQTTNRQAIVDNQLLALTTRQQSYLADQSKYQTVLTDIQALRTQLENNATDTVTLAEQLAALTVQLRAFQTIVPTPAALPLQLSISADAQVTTAQRAEQLQRLDALRVAVEAALAERQTQLDALEAPIFALQTEKQQLFNQGERLLRAREVAEETYVTVARKIDEERVASRETVARLASNAGVPENPTRPGLVALGSLLTLALLLPTVAFIIVLTWWRQRPRPAA